MAFFRINAYKWGVVAAELFPAPTTFKEDSLFTQLSEMSEEHPLITVNATIRFGKPCITGTRIAVEDILDWLASVMTQEEILTDYPELTEAHLRAAIEYTSNFRAFYDQFQIDLSNFKFNRDEANER